MRSDRYKNIPAEEIEENIEESAEPRAAAETDYLEAAQAEPEAAAGTDYLDSARAETEEQAEGNAKGDRRSRRSRKNKEERDGQEEVDLSKLKKKELLEILLRQGEEIDRLREEVNTLQARLDDRNFQFNKIGSIAEASLAVTHIFEEAEEAARIYLENIRRRINERG